MSDEVSALVCTSLQKGLYDLCDTYGIAMAYRNGVQFDKTKTYFGFHREVFLFPISFSALYPLN